MRPVHYLKCWPASSEAVLAGLKRFEFRRDDRDGRFAVGDRLVLVEWIEADRLDPESQPRATGRQIIATVAYVLRGPDFGVPPGYAVLSLADVEVEA
jgi:hypothetical protein